MTPDDILAKGKEEIVKELNLGHLKPEEQDQIIEKIGEYLMRRVLTKMFDAVTAPEDRSIVEKLVKEENFFGVREIVEKYIKDVDGMVKQEVRDGIDEYKRNVIAAVAKDPSLEVKA